MQRVKKRQVEKQIKNSNVKCENCGSGFTYFRIKTSERVCRSCGCTKKVGEEDN